MKTRVCLKYFVNYFSLSQLEPHNITYCKPEPRRNHPKQTEPVRADQRQPLVDQISVIFSLKYSFPTSGSSKDSSGNMNLHLKPD